MKTPIQELIEHFIDAWSSPSDLWKPSKVIEKIESMREKEKEVMCRFVKDYDLELIDGTIRSVEDSFDETFNTKE